MRDPQTQRARWLLAPEAAQRWRGVLEPLGEVISNYAGLIKAMILVDDLMSDLPANDPCIMVSCTCWPPRTIQLRQSVMAKAEILCENCSQPFLERE